MENPDESVIEKSEARREIPVRDLNQYMETMAEYNKVLGKLSIAGFVGLSLLVAGGYTLTSTPGLEDPTGAIVLGGSFIFLSTMIGIYTANLILDKYIPLDRQLYDLQNKHSGIDSAVEEQKKQSEKEYIRKQQ
jgi:hypothetical protein